MPWLVAVGGALAGRKYPLHSPCLVGRGPYNHVVLDDTRVSRQHAKISPESGGHVVYDLNSANGTYVNDLAAKRQKLQPNDLVRFGPFVFRFESHETGATGKHTAVRPKFVEVATLVGTEMPSKIIDTLEATPSASPSFVSGLGELEEADRRLKMLYRFMMAVSSTLDIGELLDTICKHLFEVFPVAEHVGIHLQDPESGELTARLSRRRDGTAAAPFPVSSSLHDEVISRSRAVLSAPVDRTPRTGGLSMHAPLHLDDGAGAQGFVHVRAGDTQLSAFRQADLDLLTGISSQASLALENARMHHESLKQQRLQRDLILAQEIQRSFLPRQLPSAEGIEFVTEYRAAYTVGGDFYDLFWLSPNRLGIFIGDVAGKGVSAALLMARISSDLRVAALAEKEPARVLGMANKKILEHVQHEIFVTGIYMIWDTTTHQIELANAGHLPPFIRRRSQGVLQRVDGGSGTAIGIFADAIYESTRLSLEPGDTIVLCTDGVLEASNAAEEQFGFERLEAALAGGSSRAQELATSLMRAVRSHVGDAPQSDDLTLIVCGVADRPINPKRSRADRTTDSNKTLK